MHFITSVIHNIISLTSIRLNVEQLNTSPPLKRISELRQ